MSWQEKCRAKGMRPAVFPNGPNMGKPACQYFDRAGDVRYAAAELTIAERIGSFVESVTERKAIVLGEVVETRDRTVAAVGDATGLNRGLAGVAGKVLGVPSWLVLGIAAYVGYRILEKELR